MLTMSETPVDILCDMHCKIGKGTNEKRKDKEKQERNKLKKEWIGEDISIIKKEREKSKGKNKRGRNHHHLSRVRPY